MTVEHPQNDRMAALANAASSPHSYDGIQFIRNIRIPTATAGVYLGADLYLPSGGGPAPTLITLLPYLKDANAGMGLWLRGHYFAAQGYAVLLVDFRGTGGSTGSRRPPFDGAEGDDGVVAIEWAAQQPWSNGRIGMWGASYGGISCVRTAAHSPAHLQAILPVSTLLDPEREFIHPRGAPGCLSAQGLWGPRNLFLQLLPPTTDEPGWEAAWCDRIDQADPWLLDMVRHVPGDPSWRERVIDPSTITVPTFVVGGWRDLLIEGTIRTYLGVRAPKKLMVGPWMHTWPHESPFEPMDFLPLALRWWNRWLRDEPNGIDEEPEVSFFLQGASSGWRNCRAWPPLCEVRAFAPFADNSLRKHPGAAAGRTPADTDPDTHISSEVDPTVGSLSGLVGMPTSGYGLPLDQHEDDVRCISFTSEALESAIEIVGEPSLRLDFQVVSGSLDYLVAKLTDVHPNGTSELITTGISTIGESVSTRQTMTVTLEPTAYALAAGHSLRLTIAASDFPRLWPGGPGLLKVFTSGPDGVGTLVHVPVEPSGVTRTSVDPPVPQQGVPPLAATESPTWRIARDLITGEVSVSVGETSAGYTAGHSRHLRTERIATATVAQTDPASARIQGTCVGFLTSDTGTDTVVSVSTYMTRTNVLATATVTCNGMTVIEKQWRASSGSVQHSGSDDETP